MAGGSALKLALDHVVIHVSDWDRSGEFYARVLGAQIVPTGDIGFALRFGNWQLNCHGPGKQATPVAAKPVMPGNSDLCFRWAGPIEGAVAHLRDRNVEVELGPVTRSGAGGEGRSVYFRDPDGSLLEFLSYDD